jgi:hypothetical protein
VDGNRSMSPIDYFIAIFAGMCIGLAGMAYVLG